LLARHDIRALIRRLLREEASDVSIARRLSTGRLDEWSGVLRLGEDYPEWVGRLGRRGVSVEARSLVADAWRFSFRLNRVDPRLAAHFTAGGFVAGGIADALVGGIWQGVEDQIRYDLWSRDPGLAARRAGAAAGANATVGAIGGGLTAGGWAVAVTFLEISTPPGWVIAGTAIGVTVIADLALGERIEKWWFQTLDADLQ
jgi:hypothetical protein